MAKTVNQNLSDVQAQKGELKRTFPRQTWDLMGPTKQDWEEIKSTPKELLTKEPETTQNPVKPDETKTPIVKQLTVAQQKKKDAEDAKANPVNADVTPAVTKTEEEIAADLAKGGAGDEQETK